MKFYYQRSLLIANSFLSFVSIVLPSHHPALRAYIKIFIYNH